MKIQLTNYIAGTFKLTLLNKDKPAEDKLFQTDWDYPILAQYLGWKLKLHNEPCPHSSTDGTIDCKECGVTASQFIQAAANWLNDHDGEIFENTSADGYFLYD